MLWEDLDEEQVKLWDAEGKIAHYKGKYHAAPEAPTQSPSMTTTEAMTQMSSLMKRKAMDRTPLPSQEAPPPPAETPMAENPPPQKKAKGDAFPPFCDFYDVKAEHGFKPAGSGTRGQVPARPKPQTHIHRFLESR